MNVAENVQQRPWGYFLHKNVGLLKSMFFYMHSVLGWGSFCISYCINAERNGVNQPLALLRGYGSPGCLDSGLQLVCIVGPRVSHLPLDNTPYIFYGVQIRRVCWPIKQSNLIFNKPGICNFGSVGRYQVLLENEISISTKLVSRRMHEVLYNIPLAL